MTVSHRNTLIIFIVLILLVILLLLLLLVLVFLAILRAIIVLIITFSLLTQLSTAASCTTHDITDHITHERRGSTLGPASLMRYIRLSMLLSGNSGILWTIKVGPVYRRNRCRRRDRGNCWLERCWSTGLLGDVRSFVLFLRNCILC